MKKIILTALSLLVLILISTKVASAVFGLSLDKLPDYEKSTDFRLYYAYLESGSQTAVVNLYVQKEGKDWRQTEEKDKTAVSGYFQTHGSDLYDGQGRYYFQAKAWVGGVEVGASETVSTIYDATAPGNVTDFHKERVNNTDFKIYWKCPSDSDVERTYIYRSKETSFTADSGTRVQEINCNPEESKTAVVVGDKDVDYFFALRAVDHAGNAGGVVTDAPGVVIAGQVAGASTELGTGGPASYDDQVVKLPKEEVTSSEGEISGGISSEAGEVKGEETAKKSKAPFLAWGVGLFVVAFAGYRLLKKRLKSYF